MISCQDQVVQLVFQYHMVSLPGKGETNYDQDYSDGNAGFCSFRHIFRRFSSCGATDHHSFDRGPINGQCDHHRHVHCHCFGYSTDQSAFRRCFGCFSPGQEGQLPWFRGRNDKGEATFHRLGNQHAFAIRHLSGLPQAAWHDRLLGHPDHLLSYVRFGSRTILSSPTSFSSSRHETGLPNRALPVAPRARSAVHLPLHPASPRCLRRQLRLPRFSPERPVRSCCR